MDILKSIIMLDQDTVEITYEDNIKVDLDGLKNAWVKLDAYTEKRRLKKLIIVGKRTEITHEARKYGHEEAKIRSKFIVAEAIVVHNLPQKMVANFYSNFIKELYPIKYFTEIEDAKAWLSLLQN